MMQEKSPTYAIPFPLGMKFLQLSYKCVYVMKWKKSHEMYLLNVFILLVSNYVQPTYV